MRVISLQIGIQELSQPDLSFPRLKFDHLVRLLLVGGSAGSESENSKNKPE
jgi:hypothetical protein